MCIEEFTSYAQAEEAISSKTFTFSDESNTSKSSWILGAQYHSCDDQTGYLTLSILCTLLYIALKLKWFKYFLGAGLLWGRIWNCGQTFNGDHTGGRSLRNRVKLIITIFVKGFQCCFLPSFLEFFFFWNFPF